MNFFSGQFAFMRIYKIMFSFGDDSSDGSELLTVSMLVNGDGDGSDDLVLLAAGEQGEVVDC